MMFFFFLVLFSPHLFASNIFYLQMGFMGGGPLPTPRMLLSRASPGIAFSNH